MNRNTLACPEGSIHIDIIRKGKISEKSDGEKRERIEAD
jgi:hypothetical protein